MPYCEIKPRFTKDNQPPNRGRKKGRTVGEWLLYLSKQKINFHNPLTGKPDKADVNCVIAIQLILKATQDSDLPSIKEYIDRLEGKVVERREVESKITVMQMPDIKLSEDRLLQYNLG